MSNIQKYIYSVVYPFFISKYLFKNIHEMPILKSINLEVIVKNISSETDLRILEIFSFLEQISGQRPYIKKFTSLCCTMLPDIFHVREYVCDTVSKNVESEL